MKNPKVAVVLYFVAAIAFAVAAFLNYRDSETRKVPVFATLSFAMLLLGIVLMRKTKNKRQH